MSSAPAPSTRRRIVAVLATILACVFFTLTLLAAVAWQFLGMLAGEMAPLLEGFTIG